MEGQYAVNLRTIIPTSFSNDKGALSYHLHAGFLCIAKCLQNLAHS